MYCDALHCAGGTRPGSIRGGSYSIHSAFTALGGQTEQTAASNQLLWCFSNFEVTKTVSENRARENNEEEIQKSPGSALGPGG